MDLPRPVVTMCGKYSPLSSYVLRLHVQTVNLNGTAPTGHTAIETDAHLSTRWRIECIVLRAPPEFAKVT